MSNTNENENLGDELGDNDDEIEITEPEDSLHKLQIDELKELLEKEKQNSSLNTENGNVLLLIIKI